MKTSTTATGGTYGQRPDDRYSRYRQIVDDVGTIGQPPTAGVVIVAVNGQQPDPARVAQIERELAKVPEAIRRRWQRAGGRLEIHAGQTVTIPVFGGRGPAYCYGLRCVVAAEAEKCLIAVLHELGHAVDSISGFLAVSKSPEWQAVSKIEESWQRAFVLHSPFRFYDTADAAELFASAFCVFYQSTAARASLTKQTRAFIASLETRLRC